MTSNRIRVCPIPTFKIEPVLRRLPLPFRWWQLRASTGGKRSLEVTLGFFPNVLAEHLPWLFTWWIDRKTYRLQCLISDTGPAWSSVGDEEPDKQRPGGNLRPWRPGGNLRPWPERPAEVSGVSQLTQIQNALIRMMASIDNQFMQLENRQCDYHDDTMKSIRTIGTSARLSTISRTMAKKKAAPKRKKATSKKTTPKKKYLSDAGPAMTGPRNTGPLDTKRIPF